MCMYNLISWFDIIGTIVFAISGALAAGRKDMDIFGVIVLATVTAIGGGTLRDLVLGATPVFWIEHSYYLAIIAASAIATVYLHRSRIFHQKILLYADALGLATFTIIGFDKAFAITQQYEIAIMMAVMTAVVGGMIRDVLASEVPLVLRKEVYASASFFGACLYAGMLHLSLDNALAAGIAMLVVLILRLLALRLGVSLPIFSSDEKN